MSPKQAWGKAYMEGCRITHDGKRWVFQFVYPPVERFQLFKEFGEFGDLDEIEPPSWVIEYLNEHGQELLTWANSDMKEESAFDRQQAGKLAKKYTKYFWHVLFTEHELDRISAAAFAEGLKVGSELVPGGHLPRIVGVVKEENGKKKSNGRADRYRMTPILNNMGIGAMKL